jgi:hypothetical protein
VKKFKSLSLLIVPICLLFNVFYLSSCHSTKSATKTELTDSAKLEAFKSIVIPNNLPVNEPGLSLDEFLSRFEAVVLKHDYNKVLTFLDPAYKVAQHDSFCKGNTQVFINKFFSNGVVNANEEPIMLFKNIVGIVKGDSNYDVNSKSLIVKYKVSDGQFYHPVVWTVITKLNSNNKVEYGLYGVVN